MATRSSFTRLRVFASDSSMFLGVPESSHTVVSDDDDVVDESTYNLQLLIAAVDSVEVEQWTSQGGTSGGVCTPHDDRLFSRNTGSSTPSAKDGERLRSSRGLSFNAARAVLPRMLFSPKASVVDPMAALQEPWAEVAAPPPAVPQTHSRHNSGRVRPAPAKETAPWTYGRRVMTTHELRQMPEMHLENVKVNPPRAAAAAAAAAATQQGPPRVKSPQLNPSAARPGFSRTAGSRDLVEEKSDELCMTHYVSQISDQGSVSEDTWETDVESTVAHAPCRVSGHLAEKCRSISASIESLTASSTVVTERSDMESEIDLKYYARQSGQPLPRMSIAIERPPVVATHALTLHSRDQDERCAPERRLLVSLAQAAQEHEMRRNTRCNRASAPKEEVLENWFQTFGSSGGGLTEPGSGIEPHAKRISMRSDPRESAKVVQLEHARSMPLPMPVQTRKLSFQDEVEVTHIPPPYSSTKIRYEVVIGDAMREPIATETRARSFSETKEKTVFVSSSSPLFVKARKTAPLLSRLRASHRRTKSYETA